MEEAKKIMDEQRGSCSQAIFATYGVYLSSGKLDYDTCRNIASGFGGGIASNGNVCGALTGAIM
ncbi:MAG: C-GCAxxG-C-C family (seleno)protein, partial [Promethearchaeota archaeon]